MGEDSGAGVSSAEPWSQKVFDVAATLRVRQPGFGPLSVDDDERRDRLDPEALDELLLGVRVDAKDLEGVVIGAPLEYLGNEAFYTPAAAGGQRMKEDEARRSEPRLNSSFRGGGNQPTANACADPCSRSARASWRVA